MSRITVLEVQHLIRRRQLEIRAMRRFTETSRFEDAIATATDEQLKKLDMILKSDSCHDLREWVRTSLNRPLCDCTIRELLAKARDKMIPKYSRMSRDRLIRALEKYDNAASMGGH